ncbi:hypothetical protein, partial [Ligilactobacillus agilis]|uniref:hypothetical protein n=1 Tax=Ligilactobacillus agilis TaxID=1601 RepID=UPI001CDA5FDC
EKIREHIIIKNYVFLIYKDFLRDDINFLIDKINLDIQVGFMLIWLLLLIKKLCYSNNEINK